MLQGKQYAHGIRGIHLVHEALSHMLLTAVEEFAKKNRLPWLTDETRQLIHALNFLSNLRMQQPVQQIAKKQRTISLNLC